MQDQDPWNETHWQGDADRAGAPASGVMAVPVGGQLLEARAVAIAGGWVEVTADGETLAARVALPPVYRPGVGDLLLVSRQGEKAYVIGVLEAKGTLELHTKGDLELKAGGEVRMQAGEQLLLESPEMQVRAGRLETVAEDLCQRVGNLFQRVKERFTLRAGQVVEDVEGDRRTRARRVLCKAKEDVRIDGEEINLG